MSDAWRPPSGGPFHPTGLPQGSSAGQSTFATKYDPWGPVSAVLYELGDSDFVQNAVAATGVTIPWRPLSRDEAYSHSTRIRAFRRDISAAYQNLTQEQRGLFAQIVVKAMLRRHNVAELRAGLLDKLADIDWTISPDGTLTTNDALISEQFFPVNSEYDAYVTFAISSRAEPHRLRSSTPTSAAVFSPRYGQSHAQTSRCERSRRPGI